MGVDGISCRRLRRRSTRRRGNKLRRNELRSMLPCGLPWWWSSRGFEPIHLQRLRWRLLALSMRPSGNPSVLKKGGAAETIASLICMPLWANAKVDCEKRKNSELLKPNGPEITYSPIFAHYIMLTFFRRYSYFLEMKIKNHI